MKRFKAGDRAGVDLHTEEWHLSRNRFRAGGIAVLTVAAMAALGAAAPTAALAEEADVPWLDTGRTTAERTELLLDASSLHQKYRWLNEQAANAPQQTEFGDVTYPAQVPGTPTVVYTDGPDGVRSTPGVTAFPAPIALAASWDLGLNEAKSAALAAEAFDKGKNGVLGPGLAAGRTPLSGRTPEYLGEDPLLTGQLAASAINALQSVDGKPIMADIKHYIANEQELDRQTSSSNIDERTLRQVYDLPVEIAVAESDPASVMCSYNQINGVYGCENPILDTNLKGLMGFAGYVVSDFGAVHSTAAALNAGLDQELNAPKHFTPDLLDEALAAGDITEQRIDEAAGRVVSAYIEHGLFDTPLPETPVEDASTPEHKSIALDAAQQGSVLLKNDGLLPLNVDAGAEIAVIGATASSTPTDDVSARTVCSMQGFGGNTFECEDLVSPEDAIRERADEIGATVTFDAGTDPAAAAHLASSADVAIVFGYQKMGEFSDLTDLSLQGGGDALIDAVASANPHTVAVLNTGSAVEMPWIDQTAAVLEAWYPGEQMGPALVSLLWGEANPSGKLPMTFPVSLADTPTAGSDAQYPGVFADGSTERTDDEEIRQVDYAEGLEIGYKWYDERGIDPLFAFGHGLSYTEFAYSDLQVDTASDDDHSAATVSFTVENTGDVRGAEIPQVYLTLPEAADEPGKRLVGFDRIELEPGASERVELVVDSAASNRPFSVWDVDGDEWRMTEGDYTVAVGASSRAIELEEGFTFDADVEPPVVTVAATPESPDGNDDWYVSQVAVEVTATDDVDSHPTLEVNVDDAGWAPYEEPVVLDADGAHSLEARATDAGGNVSESAAWSGKIDRTAPEATAAVEGADIVLSATDEASGVAQLEWAAIAAEGETPEAWNSYEEPIEVEPGDRIAYRASDVAGNMSDVSEHHEEAVAAPRLRVEPGDAAPGDAVEVTGEHIPAGDYTVVLRSEPIEVAAVSATEAGTIAASFRVPAETEPGAHTVELISADDEVIASADLQVTASSALSPTGGSGTAAGLTLAAMVLIALGAGFMAVRRKRAVDA